MEAQAKNGFLVYFAKIGNIFFKMQSCLVAINLSDTARY